MRQSYCGLAIAGIFSLFCTFGVLASSVYAAAAGGGGGGNTGIWTTLDPPGVFFGSLDNVHKQGTIVGTIAEGISDNNIVGYFADSSGRSHGYLYDGTTWTTLDAPGANPTFGTDAEGISGGNIVGSYADSVTISPRGFLYDGTTWTTLDAPGATNTYAADISGNNIVGSYIKNNLERHGFLYD